PELGVVALLEREVLEYRQIHVLEARVTEEVPAHRAKGSPRLRNQNRFAGHEAARVVLRTGVGGDRRALRPHRGGLVVCKGTLDAGDAAGHTAVFAAGAVGNGLRAK